MKTFEVAVSHGIEPVKVNAESAEWDASSLRFKVGGDVVAVFFTPIYFKQVEPTKIQKLAA